MEISQIIMAAGFLLAAYSVVGNDVIQTLGTFLSSNEKRPWYVLWGYAGSILAAVLILGWLQDDIAYGRLDKINIPETLSWWYLLPPLVLMVITRIGIPVSTTFLIITFFSSSSLLKMVNKSLFGYLIAFIIGGLVYLIIAKITEKKFIEKPLDDPLNPSIWTNRKFWTAAQWLSTGFLWSQWLTQDLANIYIYLLGQGQLSALPFFLSLAAILGLLAYIFYSKGGAIQEIVKAKTNTVDIRSATFVDLIYGIVLLIFKQNVLGLWEAKLPMSTTWVFIGLLAGRELAIRYRLEGKITKAIYTDLGKDLGKIFVGLVISVLLVFIMNWASGTPILISDLFK